MTSNGKSTIYFLNAWSNLKIFFYERLDEIFFNNIYKNGNLMELLTVIKKSDSFEKDDFPEILVGIYSNFCEHSTSEILSHSSLSIYASKFVALCANVFKRWFRASIYKVWLFFNNEKLLLYIMCTIVYHICKFKILCTICWLTTLHNENIASRSTSVYNRKYTISFQLFGKYFPE